jgi:hypothetical protein
MSQCKNSQQSPLHLSFFFIFVFVFVFVFFFVCFFFGGGGIFCDTPSVVNVRLETLNRLEIPTGYSEDVTLRADNAMSKRKRTT